MDSSNRISRYKAFKCFLESSQSSFEELSKLDKDVESLNLYYKLYICPGGSQGGANDRLLEIFYGHRPFDTQSKNPFDRNSITVLVEQGARLHYNLLDNGQVVIILYPASTESLTLIEDAIIISSGLNPHRLGKMYKLHFALFVAYMRCTSLDGTPTIADKILVFWLRSAKPLIVNKKKQQTKLLSNTIGIFKFAMTVGLSGFLLAAVMATITPPTTDYSNDMMQINQTTKKISEQIGNLSIKSEGSKSQSEKRSTDIAKKKK